MDPPTRRCGAWRPCYIPHQHHHHHRHHHHHHHHRHLHHHHHIFICPNQHQHHQPHCLFNYQNHAYPKFAPFPQNQPQPIPPRTFPYDLTSGFQEAHQMLEEQENGGVEEEEDDDPVFVLTDEWREFFAKSEAERKQRKKQANMKGKEVGKV